MIKKTIKYKGFDGVEYEEDFYFNLTKAEALEMETSASGGLTKQLQHIISTSDNKKIMDTFKEIILGSYGVKTADGKQFIKSPSEIAAFKYSQAYSELYMELATDENAAVEFVKGILPKSLVDSAKLEDHKEKE